MRMPSPLLTRRRLLGGLSLAPLGLGLPSMAAASESWQMPDEG